jgi:hypothetical protein
MCTFKEREETEVELLRKMCKEKERKKRYSELHHVDQTTNIATTKQILFRNIQIKTEDEKTKTNTSFEGVVCACIGNSSTPVSHLLLLNPVTTFISGFLMCVCACVRFKKSPSVISSRISKRQQRSTNASFFSRVWTSKKSRH